MTSKTVAAAVSTFGVSAKAKRSNVAIAGAAEDQLRGPLETLIYDLAEVAGLPTGSIHAIGKTNLSDLKTIPDFAVIVSNALVGFIEIKAPRKGADPRKFDDQHDKEQWAKLKSLPNLIYTDGQSFSLWRDGKLQSPIVHLDGELETSGAKLGAPPALISLISDFLNWKPIPPSRSDYLHKNQPKRLIGLKFLPGYKNRVNTVMYRAIGTL